MDKELIDIIKDRFSSKLNSPSVLSKAISTTEPELIERLNECLNANPQYEKLSYLIISICKGLQLKTCKECGRIIPYSKRSHDFCSGKCAQQSSLTKKKCEDTCMEHFGTKYPTQSNEVLKTRDDNNLKKYGTTNLRKVKEIDEKIKNALIEKYGAPTPAKNDEVKQKMKATCLERYGVEYSGASKEKKEKTFKTFKERYGGHPMQNEDVKKQMLLSNRKNYYDNLVEKCKENDITPLFLLDEYVRGYGKDVSYHCKCERCGNEFDSQICLTKTSREIYEYLPCCPSCSPIEEHSSFGEKELLEFIKSLLPNEEIIENDREILNGKELDIFIPRLNIAFEFNGDYWHSYGKKQNKSYHQEKTLKCKEKGIRLVHIFEHDWMFKKFILKDKIRSILGIGIDNAYSVYARKCKVEHIDAKFKNAFLNEWHIQGEDKSSVNLGLFYENELVAVMTFGKPRFTGKYQWELIRYATSRHVAGGAGKLLKYFEREYSPESLVTYADYSFSVGNMYRQLGFTELRLSSPNYYYVKNDVIYSRYQCQKKNLRKVLGDRFNESLSEDENMKNAGFLKIYDCGNLVFVK